MAGQPKSQGASQTQRARMLERVLRREGSRLRNLARSNSANPADADDALQDACLAFIRFYEGGEEGAIRWLTVVVKRSAWAIGRRDRHRGSLLHVETVGPSEASGQEIVPVDHRDGTAELVERAEALERRIELLGKLKPDERATLILIGLGVSYAEIGELRGWTHTKINRCAAEGRARLRELEAAEGEKP